MENSPSLALVMIVKNEAKGLEAAVNSVKDFCDEIIILVDSKSTDATHEIAKRIATVCHLFDWQDDFSKTRNLAAECAKSDWIIYIDGHELVKNPENIKKHLAGGHDGVLVRVKMENGTTFPACRLYRRGRQFGGSVHEQLDCKLTVAVNDFIIEHHRLDLQAPEASAERAKQRDDQMPRLMGNDLKKDKKNTLAAFHMALFYESKGDWKKALKYQKKYLAHSNVPGGRWFMFYHMALCFIERKKYFRAWLATCGACKENPFRWEISELRGVLFFRQKQWQRAAEFFIESFNANQGDVSFQPKEKNRAMTWNFIGECFFNLNEPWKASEAFRKAADVCEDPAFKDLLARRATLMSEIAKSNR